MENLLNRIVKYSIYALVFLSPIFWLPFPFEIFEYNKQYLLFFLVSFAFLARLLKQVVYDKEIRFRKSPIDYLVLGFLFVSIISVIFSVDKNSSIFGFYGRFSNGLIGLLSLAGLYFLITNNVRENASPEEKRSPEIGINKLLSLFLGSAGAVVAVSYFSVFGLWSKIAGFLPPAMLQKTFNPAAGSLEGLAVFLAIVVVLLSGLLLGKAKNIFYWLLLFASLGLLVIVNFTPAWIILLASLVLFVAASLVKRIFKENVNRLLVPIFLIVISLAFIIWQPIKINLPKEQVLSQSVSWQVALSSATDNVKNGLLGSGLGTFHYDFSKYKPQSFNQTWMWQIRFDRAGSHLAELLGSIGFLGLLVYLALAGLVLIIFWFLTDSYFAGLPFAMAFTAVIASQFIYYQNTSLAFVFWLILGFSAVSWKAKSPALIKEKKISFTNFPESSLIFLTSLIILGTAISALYFYGIKYYLADVDYSKALSTLGELRVENLEKAVNGNPGSPNYRTVLARAYLTEALLEMQKSASEQDSAKIQLLVSRSIDQARAATMLAPNQVANWETLGVIYREIRTVAQGATEWGVSSFENAIKLEPTNPVLYTELGRLYLLGGDKVLAKDNFDKALEKKSDYVTATIQLALLLEQDDILDEAIKKLEQVAINNPFNVEALFQLARLYFNNKRPDEAVALFQNIIILVPEYSNAHYSLGVVYASQGKKPQAIQEFERVLELNPGNADVMQKLRDLRGF